MKFFDEDVKEDELHIGEIRVNDLDEKVMEMNEFQKQLQKKKTDEFSNKKHKIGLVEDLTEDSIAKKYQEMVHKIVKEEEEAKKRYVFNHKSTHPAHPHQARRARGDHQEEVPRGGEGNKGDHSAAAREGRG